ncbi:CTP synthetase [Rhodalgimonas zhirmunskyi]|uniref:CTP synthetase n=1 Tax=Rhodalgimonas zhirmunskyi TaxID=2964767 RepID=A0AAJ1X631_9RHOB|nr:CTP synthetase [Rhodoalgimonas zhirmunskyi]MDQ2094759.1 CTP synthetase [Rhodoalgimonas zhirmunskyi]
MFRLAMVVHVFLGATLAGSAMVVALTMGYDTLNPLLISALVGYLISIPASWYVAKQIANL